MRKKILIPILIVFAGIILFLAAGITGKITKLARNRILNAVFALDLYGNQVKIPLQQRDTSIIMVFNSECEFCQLELYELLDNYNTFRNYRIFLLSAQPVDDLEQAAKEYNLYEYPVIRLLRLDIANTRDPFISAPTPSLFVYDPNGRMIVGRKGYAAPLKLISDLRYEKNK